MRPGAGTTNAAALAGGAFEDILDGYFPLQESVRQMMARQGFAKAWITIQHAPIMNIRDLAPADPVPLSLPKIYAGMIDVMSLVGTQDADSLALGGVGDWFWVDPRDRSATFPKTVRLGEPAFVRGVGIGANGAQAMHRNIALLDIEPRARIADAVASAIADLGWTSCRVWGGSDVPDVIAQTSAADLSGALNGQTVSSPGEADMRAGTEGGAYVLLNTSPGQMDEETLELALRV